MGSSWLGGDEYEWKAYVLEQEGLGGDSSHALLGQFMGMHAQYKPLCTSPTES